MPQEWQSSAFSQHSASWGCAYLAAPALIGWVGDDADTILSVATATMILSAIIVELTFVDTRPVGCRTQRMSSVVSGYIIEGARDLAEVGKKMSGVDLADFFNGGREREPSPPQPAPATGGGNRDHSTGARRSLAGARCTSRERSMLPRRQVVGVNGGSPPATNRRSPEAADRDGDARDTSRGAGRGGGNGELVDIAGRGEGREEKGGRPSSAGASVRALVGVFKGMMREKLVLVSFVLQVMQPAQDLAPLVAKFNGGPSVLAGITSSRSLCRVLIPMTPLIPWLVRVAGGAPGKGASAKRGGDRAVAACMCVLMAALVVCVPGVETLSSLHHVMAIKGLCYIVRESTAGAVVARSSSTATVGAFFGWQHCIKGMQGMFSHFLTGWLSAYSIAAPYYLVGICDLLYAFTYLYI